MESDAKCSKCGEGTIDDAHCPRWCKACRAKWQREYQALRKMKSRGYAAGAAAMKAQVVKRFQDLQRNYPMVQFSAATAAVWVANEQFSAPQE